MYLAKQSKRYIPIKARLKCKILLSFNQNIGLSLHSYRSIWTSIVLYKLPWYMRYTYLKLKNILLKTNGICGYVASLLINWTTITYKYSLAVSLVETRTMEIYMIQLVSIQMEII